MKEIERWLAAHFLACSWEQQAAEEGADDARIRYQGKTEMGLDASKYGQMVKLLDTTGKLAYNIGKKVVGFYAATSFAT